MAACPVGFMSPNWPKGSSSNKAALACARMQMTENRKKAQTGPQISRLRKEIMHPFRNDKYCRSDFLIDMEIFGNTVRCTYNAPPCRPGFFKKDWRFPQQIVPLTLESS